MGDVAFWLKHLIWPETALSNEGAAGKEKIQEVREYSSGRKHIVFERPRLSSWHFWSMVINCAAVGEKKKSERTERVVDAAGQVLEGLLREAFKPSQSKY